MKKHIFFSVASAFLIFSCQRQNIPATKKDETVKKELKSEIKTHNAKNSLDWSGTYEGTLPCADCEGIKYIVELRKNGNFFIEQEYLGKETVYQDEGFYKWDESKNALHLNSNVSPLFLKVEENKLRVLDQKGNEFTEEAKEKYVLKKVK